MFISLLLLLVLLLEIGHAVVIPILKLNNVTMMWALNIYKLLNAFQHNEKHDLIIVFPCSLSFPMDTC